MKFELNEKERLEYYENFKKSGKLARETLEYGASLIKPGASYVSVLRSILKKIEDLGAKPAFPPQMSLNETAAHFMPSPNDDVVFNDELIKLDIGINVDGAIGDNATTVDLSGKWKDLVKASREAVNNATKIIEVGTPIRNIGKEIQETILSYNDYTSVKNLSGHGLAPYVIHCKPTIPNYDNGNETKITKDMTFACEPFATPGKGLIRESGDGWIFRMVAKKPVRDPVARKLISKFEEFNGLPFSLFETDTNVPYFKLRVALKQMERLNIIQSYPPLVEETKGMVSQAEHSILIDSDGKKFITTR
jgi:methionyl aminopeptidase